jgi:hypothetical protein
MDYHERRRRRASEYRRVMAEERATETAEERQARYAETRWMARTHHLSSFLLVGTFWAVLAGPALAGLLDRQTALRVGIVIVVALGASGQVLQGLGEQFSKTPSESRLGRLAKRRPLKAYGYYCAAMTYTATASIALANGVPALLEQEATH